MAVNQGKKFEDLFEQDYISSVPNGFIYRLHDQVSGYKTVSANPCDYITYLNGTLYLVELKSTKKSTFSFSSFPQYDRLLKFNTIDGVRCILIIWFIKEKRCIGLDVDSVTKIVLSGKKSINPNTTDKSLYVEIPTKVIRVYPECDYSVLFGGNHR